ncbi:hypothetical protein LX15_005265 [Streptoalloteichus tenebrarius]|uniref:PE family protein n=1 Tax=Streptoalloteichus tenebrarius (strain ATCC 17920 / DSM 40477 / JCM 4838 / CBS 697.72 / NBRC 16177 / NCIMB 11028 / NRRL B-12390 / A12253. 1 / ISP 5477) TaxID=1933 RepID=A0ABT1I176_STRSD|nr:hypothetical protein [Streptoalloteichus tenebrarius]MCP2261539.1 hypothetical protein [Streptoalloteichus tenebrarius]BFF02686.1 hypothetical protein GCM10020241_43610 [Streptoalloteichus tenebrarius]
MADLVSGVWSGVGAAVGGIAGAVAKAAAGAGASGGTVGYTIDRDAIPSLIEQLEKAKEMVNLALVEAARADNFPAPGTDPYSPTAAEQMGPKLVQNHTDANKRYQQDIQNMIDSLNAAMRSYDNAEDSARSSMRQKRV